MLTKFDTRSPRVKAVVLHNKRPWVLCGLHNGVVQIWDYRLGSLIDTFEDNENTPVRGVDFHHSQPLFCTGSDDCRVKVWNFKLRRCTCTFTGHLDYIRTVQFHREQPWIVSASDDMSLRIWNWQNRSNIAIVTGHNGWVMCAQFHPREDLIVSASLDGNIRVWDITGLRASKRNQDSMGGAADIFSSSDVFSKFMLEGHDKGVNWASFHPTKSLVVSASDDRSIRIWKMDDTRAYELDRLTGHNTNVCCVTYFKDYIVSASEDHTIRVWDASMRQPIQTHRRDNDRFWVVASHPDNTLLAAGHDTGLQVFKLERERPAWAIKNNVLYFVKERSLYTYDFDSNNQTVTMTMRRNPCPPSTLSLNPDDQSATLWYDFDGGVFEQFTIPKRGGIADNDVKKGYFTSAVFYGGSKFAVLDKSRNIIARHTQNDVSKVVKEAPITGLDKLFPAPPGSILLRSDTTVALFNVAQKAVVAEHQMASVKHVFWSQDYSKVALMGKYQITICNKKLVPICVINETTRMKSAAFDEEKDVLYYATYNHLKYAFCRTGEASTLQTIDAPIYLIRAKGDQLWWITRLGQVVQKKIDNTELKFKMALQQESFREVIHHIKSKKMQGQALVAYLHKHGHPQLAMHFVSDPMVKFNLALECGVLDIAKQTATELDSPECWRKLSESATKFGEIQLAQLANAKTGNFSGLGLQCVLTGDLAALSNICSKSNDESFNAQYSLFTGECEGRIRSLAQAGQLPLAYSVAMSNGQVELGEALLGKMDADVAERCRNMHIQGALAPVEVEPITSNWPKLEMPESYVTRMLKTADDYVHEPSADAGGGAKAAGGGGFGDSDDDLFAEEGGGKQDSDLFGSEDGEGGQQQAKGHFGDDDSDLGFSDEEDVKPAKGGASTHHDNTFVIPREGESVAKHWIETTNVPAYHVAAGSFSTAIQLLQRQIGLKDAKPLESSFLSIWASCHATLPVISGMPTTLLPKAQIFNGIDFNGKHIPRLPNQIAVMSEKIQSGYNAVSEGRFEDAMKIFVGVLHSVIFQVVTNKDELDKVRKARDVASEYVQALSVEVARIQAKSAGGDGSARMLELACYFTHFKIEPAHLILALYYGMRYNFKGENKKIAGILGRRLLELDPAQDKVTQARGVIRRSEEEGAGDKIKLDYDDRNPFTLCSVSKKPMYRGTVDPIRCPFCRAPAHPTHKGTTCPVCLIAELGNTSCAGLVSSVEHL